MNDILTFKKILACRNQVYKKMVFFLFSQFKDLDLLVHKIKYRGHYKTLKFTVKMSTGCKPRHL